MKFNRWVVILGWFASACANSPASQNGKATGVYQDVDNDPFESVNRPVWAFDIKLDRYVLKPIAVGYRSVIPQFARSGVINVLNNLNSPAIFMNDILQGNIDRAVQTVERMALNTIFGLGGFFDVASKGKIPFHDADFGQTLGAWGIKSGPYLVLPFLGPSDPRDAIGNGVDSLADPFGIEMNAYDINTANYTRTVLGLVSDRAETIDALDDVEASSLDFYAAVRSLYQQRRAGKVSTAIHDGADVTPDIMIDIPETDDGSQDKPSAPAAPNQH